MTATVHPSFGSRPSLARTRMFWRKLRDEGWSLWFSRAAETIADAFRLSLWQMCRHSLPQEKSDETRRNPGCILHCSCFHNEKTCKLRLTKRICLHALSMRGAGNTVFSLPHHLFSNVIMHVHRAESYSYRGRSPLRTPNHLQCFHSDEGNDTQ